jgi:hypothetical protein
MWAPKRQKFDSLDGSVDFIRNFALGRVSPPKYQNDATARIYWVDDAIKNPINLYRTRTMVATLINTTSKP